MANIFLACIILFAFAIFFYFFVSDILVTRQIQSMDTLNSSFQEQVDDSIRDLDIVSVNINYSNMSKHVLNQTFDLDISDNMLKEMTDLFLSISGTELKADQINLYDFSGNVLQVGLSTMVKRADATQTEWISGAIDLGGSKIISAPYKTDIYSKSAKYDQWFVSLYRSFNNQYGRSVGAIETVKRAKSIFKSIISYEKKTKSQAAAVYVFDKSGNLVYPYDTEQEQADSIQKYYTLTQDMKDSSPIKNPINQSAEYASRLTSKYTGYTYLTIVKESQILAPVNRLLVLLVGVVTIFLLISALISYRLSRSIVKPIKHLKHIIQRIQLDTLGKEKATAYPVYVNELEELYQAFQHMNENLQESMNQLMESKDREMKSRSLALQAQMNPHFYYNSLSSIIVLAENGDTDVVIRMCRNLSNIMRYITNTGNSIVTLGEEIDYVQKDLYCMKVRYQSSLNYSIEVDDALLEQPIPKLIIQPLVENALKYGTNCQPPWIISVRGYQTEDRWVVEVTDSGNGFTEEAISHIDERIREADTASGMPDLNINGLGILNVYLRWRIFCGEELIFHYGNTKDGHGQMTIGRYIKKHREGIEQT